MAKKGKGVSHLHTQSREWLFLSEDRTSTRATSQMSSTSEEQLETALRHLRQMSTPELKVYDWELPQGVRPLLTARHREGTERLAPGPNVKYPESKSALSMRFPMTLQVLQEKTTRKQRFKQASGVSPAVKRTLKPKYHSAWYLPPSLWKTVPADPEPLKCRALVQAKTPYYSLQAESHQTRENIKQLQKMPMMGRFKGHLETLSLRVPPYLQEVAADIEEKSVGSVSSGTRDLFRRLHVA